MKIRIYTVFVLALAALMPGRMALGAGVVIYKEFSFDSDSQAELAEYSSFEHFTSVDNVHTTSGQTLQITPGQGPVYVPDVGSPGGTAAQVTGTIVAAERRFPQFAAKLEGYRRSWATVARAAPVARPEETVAAAPQPAAVETASASAGSQADRPDEVLRTKDGAAYRGWKVTGVEADNVVISHADGISRVPIAELPNNLWGFPPEVVARVEQLRQQSTSQAQAEFAKAAPHPAGSPPRHRHGRPGDDE